VLGDSWNLTLLVAGEPGRRNRRTIDGLLLAVGALVVGLGAVIAETASTEDYDVAQALVTVLGWAPALWRTVLIGAFGLALTIAADAVLRRRWALVRDLTVGVVVVAAIAPFLGRLVDADWFPVEAHPWSRWGFPELRLAVVVVVLVVAAPELTGPVRRLATGVVPLAAVGAVALEAASPSRALAGVALGLPAGAVVRLAFGSAASVPRSERVLNALASLGVHVDELRISQRQRVGAAVFVRAGHEWESADGPSTRSGRAGHAAAGPPLAPSRLP
jgi:hypothetical protein